MQYLVSSNLNILIQGNEPTFIVCNRKEVTDLTIGTNKISNLVNNWHVSEGPTLSDHGYTCFQIGNMVLNHTSFRDYKRTNWELHRDDLKVNLETISWNIHTARDVHRSVDQLQQAIISAYCQTCPAKTTLSPRNAPW
jgi:hypothetical protein